MTILVRRLDGGSFECITGQARLRADLEVFGKATVTDIETRDSFEVHDVDGQILVLKNGRDAVAETLAAEVIARATGR